MNTSNPRAILGAFIRAHREQLQVAKTSARRRTPGWRREELAEAAAVSVTWITWLEQGRDIAASPSALARLAQALNLNSAERASLFDLAGKRDPDCLLEEILPLPLELLHLPSTFSGPAYLLNSDWTAIAWNKAASNLFIGWLDDDITERNLLKFVFLNPNAQELIVDWPERTERLLAEFHSDYNRRAQNPAMQTLVDHLLAQSELFRRLWIEQAVLRREGGERKFNHPVLGPQRYLQITLLAALHLEYKLVCLLPIVKT